MYPFLDLVVTSVGTYQGSLASKMATAKIYNVNQYYSMWQFRVDVKTKADFSIKSSTWSGTDVLRLCSGTDPTTYIKEWLSPTSAQTYTLNPGTYYLVVSVKSSTSKITGNYKLTADVPLIPVAPEDGLVTVGTGGSAVTNTPTIGGIKNARVRVQINPLVRVGVVNDTWGLARYGFMWFKGDKTTDYGKLMVPCGTQADPIQFASYLEGKQSSDGNPYPYSGTPTGEALTEAKNYLSQGTSAYGNTWTKGSATDPYYQNIDGKLQPISCRQSSVLLISDGNWSAGGLDPITPAYTMHTTNLRPDISTAMNNSTLSLTANVYTLFLFNQPTCATGTYPTCQDSYFWGRNSMEWIAFYGGFTPNLAGCAYANPPYPYPTTSSDFTTIKNTSKNYNGQTYKGSVEVYFDKYFSSSGTGSSKNTCQITSPLKCCKEWDTNSDGAPDNFYNCQQGSDLAAALSNVITQVTAQTASSSAVATLSQQTGEGDEIIRGLYQAVPPSSDSLNVGKLLWWGHLEAYWPDTNGNYAFELYGPTTSYKYMMCKDMLGAISTANCYDCAKQTGGPWPAYTSRNVLTVLPNSSGSINYHPTLQQFTNSNSQITSDLLGLPSTATAAQRTNLINWVLGQDPDGLNLYRTRQDPAGNRWILGDIVYSTPVVVGPPSLGSVSQNTKAIMGGTMMNVVATNPTAASNGFTGFYLNWRQIPNIKYRDKVAYVGGNDGMLHAFLVARWNATTQQYDTTPSQNSNIGKEIWAYIPSNLLDQLQNLADPTYGATGTNVTGTTTCKHRFMVDLAPAAYQVFMDSSMSASALSSPAYLQPGNTVTGSDTAFPSSIANWPWRTIILGGERGGGDLYFAIDVTDPYHPTVLWEYEVFRDMTATFDFKSALSAFMDACYQGVSITPGDVGTCVAPQVPTSVWNNQCNKCACLDSGCTMKATDPSNCWNLLKQLNLTTAVWKPFDDPNLYQSLKILPVSWSKPSLARIGLPAGISINPCDPAPGSAGGGGQGSGCYPKCTGNTGSPVALSGIRNVAVIGGGSRIFDPAFNVYANNPNWPDFYAAGFQSTVNSSFLLGLDITTGENMFRYFWPYVMQAANKFFPQQNRACDSKGMNCQTRVPYAMSDPVTLNLLDRSVSLNSPPLGDGGFTDYIYVGDLNGVMYGIKINMYPTQGVTGDTGFYVDIWNTKAVPVQSNDSSNGGITTTNYDWGSNIYRGGLQPITVQPSVAVERATQGQSQALRVIFGTGKHENVSTDASDANDIAKMSLYNLRDPIQLPVAGAWPSGSYGVTGQDPVTTLNYFVRWDCPNPYSPYPPTTPSLYPSPRTDQGPPLPPYTLSSTPPWRCNNIKGESGCDYSVTGTATTQHGCRWSVPGTGSVVTPDTCLNSSQSQCAANSLVGGTSTQTVGGWACIYDLQGPGEKVINKALTAGGVTFFTTFSPFMSSDPCSTVGEGFLYAFDFMCQAFPEGFNPVPNTGNTFTSYSTQTMQDGKRVMGVKADLGAGVPSQPILDSSGQYVIIQTGTGSLQRIKVNLQTPPANVKGWKESN